ncbi:2-dehydro-3-deoxygluconokinase [Caldicellulosiruptor bescii]|uniref:PfkB domain protein n=2 Tax=Caldicellulosiruptor bescii TaxID=31899 RepID=B9MNC3_CALBD|nr:sugar kinase [Caldicellulosiruptor bescii]ACM61454.1 PfkB domain protein [Caldicellulosiruptor bescii DSM 6725]PBC88733.1 2-dehydro-3-deoxygluconokinase [Caldicellulosiruptor bescii]PBC91786.1 2-dehydro-3-deoxygluconokinase [Caldicellulosiruptor bescii]PBD02803.1 2-dehydro-3-deoxygluconokinase [Caldicellulosiruptor bescii]PBD07581.1 2-dehydro-3-deoxygluconokinase [Caldicellulosiruptor bescii]
MFELTSFGEIMLRLSPPGYQRFVQATSFDINFGGAEANVVVALSNIGVKTSYVTLLPQNPLGDATINFLRRYGVDTSYIKRKGRRLGIYFLEKGVGQRASSVVYDRSDSAINEIQPGDIEWEQILKKTKIFFSTGITAALSQNVLNELKMAFKTAKNAGAKVAFDINYRSKLWSYDRANEVISELMPYVDILITNEEHVRRVLKIEMEDKYFEGIDLTVDGQKVLFERLQTKYQNLERIILAARRSISASKNIFFAYTKDENGNIVFSEKREIEIVDRVGAGDAFTAGVLYSILRGIETTQMLEVATYMCALKHTVEGDSLIVTEDEIKQVFWKDGSGMMKR